MERVRRRKLIPAPVLVVLCLLGGFVAHRLHPVRFLPDLGIAGPLVGAALCAIALATGISGVREFHRHQTPTSPFQETTALVTSGVFRRTRNPMYLSFVVLMLGIAIAIDSAAFLVAALLLALLLQALVIKPEEAVLSDSFGEAFESYRARTRRWL